MRRPGRGIVGFRPLGETGRQRLRRWVLEYEQDLVKQAQELGIYVPGRHSRKWYAERVKEARPAYVDEAAQ
jgi:hypothetical protein